ncbi:hypothetical protein STEG23_033387, partial [Scotinomys teguina]
QKGTRNWTQTKTWMISNDTHGIEMCRELGSHGLSDFCPGTSGDFHLKGRIFSPSI